MNQVEFDGVLEQLRASCRQAGLAGFPLEEVFLAATSESVKRKAALKVFASSEASEGVAYDLLTLIDTVATATAIQAGKESMSSVGDSVPSHVIDLWIGSTAARALWFERFVLWPTENPDKKLEILLDTARKLGAESIGRAVTTSSQPVKFIEFVASLSRR